MTKPKGGAKRMNGNGRTPWMIGGAVVALLVIFQFLGAVPWPSRTEFGAVLSAIDKVQGKLDALGTAEGNSLGRITALEIRIGALEAAITGFREDLSKFRDDLRGRR